MSAEQPEIQKNLKEDLDVIFKGDNRLTPQEMKVLQNNYDVKKSWEIIKESRKTRTKLIKEINRGDIMSAIKNFPEYKEWEKFFNRLWSERAKRALQNNIGVNSDWYYWPQTFFALYNYSEEKWGLVKSEARTWENPTQIQKGISDINSSSLQSLNGKLSWKREDFIAQFWQFTSMLSSQIDIPQWYVNAIIHQETIFWLGLKHSGWSRWLMQLTIRPFADMHGDTYRNKVWKIWVSSDQSRKYIPIFQQLDIQALENIVMWDGKTIRQTLTDDVWAELKEISNKQKPVNILRFREIISHFQQLLKKPADKNNYYHVLNMIVGSVYLKSIIENNHGNLKLSAKQYNWNYKKNKKWQIIANFYSGRVMGYFEEERKILNKKQ